MGRVSARPALLSIFLVAVRVSSSELSASEDERAIAPRVELARCVQVSRTRPVTVLILPFT